LIDGSAKMKMKLLVTIELEDSWELDEEIDLSKWFREDVINHEKLSIVSSEIGDTLGEITDIKIIEE
jgi:hypothetical protein